MQIGASLVAAAILSGSEAAAAAKELELAISYTASQSARPLDGRIILLLSRDLKREPRSHVEPGQDGYPKPIFDKVTGVIDPAVAEYWREHFDLSYIIARDWQTLAPKLQGKLHLYVGNGDNYYLTDSVYFGQARLESLQPPYGGTVAYGERAEHCWNGDPKAPHAYSRLRYNFQYLPLILKRIRAAAPAGANLKSWRY